MKQLAAIALGIALLPTQGALAQTPAPPLEQREYILRNFRTESGVVLPEARLVYTTLGQLNAAGTNAVLLPSWYMADFNGYNWLIGASPVRVFDSSRDFLILTELFGNGRSSSPSNTPEPFHGPRFPVTTIRDNVAIVHRLLSEELKVNHLRAIVGFSMGAEQAFQWAVSHPDFMDAIVATAGTAKCYGHCYVFLEGGITALTADAAWQDGDYTSPPTKGLQAFDMVGAGWVYSQEWWRRELWRTITPPDTTFEQFLRPSAPFADANDYILQARTWQRHDVGDTPGFDGDVEKALRSIKARVLYMPSETDLYFPITAARYEQALIARITFTPIPSLWGHTAGMGSNPADLEFLNEHIGMFLNGRSEGL